MTRREHYILRITGAHKEYQAAEVAVTLLMDKVRADPSFLAPVDLRSRVATQLRENLENTYVVRLYSEFEAGLRDAWKNAWGRTSEPPTRDLLDSAAARRGINQDVLDFAHRVRVFRNELIHRKGDEVEPVTIGIASKRLCEFFGRLPKDW
jgi:hypothetical protein